MNAMFLAAQEMDVVRGDHRQVQTFGQIEQRYL
jgi:hypothetical protein